MASGCIGHDKTQTADHADCAFFFFSFKLWFTYDQGANAFSLLMITLELIPIIGHHITKFYEIISEPTLPSKTKSQAQVFSSTWRLAPRAKMITDVICLDSDADLKVIASYNGRNSSAK